MGDEPDAGGVDEQVAGVKAAARGLRTPNAFRTKPLGGSGARRQHGATKAGPADAQDLPSLMTHFAE